MQILTSPAQLQRLEGILKKSLPLALPVYGAVLNINRGNPGQFEVLVDKWPDFGAVLARPRGERCWRLLGLELACWVHWEQGPGEHWGVLGLNLGMLGAEEHHDWTGKRWGVLGAGIGVLGTQPDPSVRVGCLLPSHVDLLNETWPYGGNARSRRYLAELLGRFPHVCLQDSAGEPLSWVLTDHFGTGTHSFTLPAHRRRGHMQVALTVAAQRAQARGFPTFG
ncbi:GLYL3 protein, partial [Piprites chloris]|nr:GLYL3 protein [Piprites chloris]